MGWVVWVVWTVRAVWVLATAACLLASDLPGVGVEALRRAAHYGKLQSEVFVCVFVCVCVCVCVCV